ncbi:MAG TPA: hypothetical protein VHB48_00190 [Chitinophagaceae bacterium]|nr:hypothetical protein [Chitinophagaceae bacterium]
MLPFHKHAGYIWLTVLKSILMNYQLILLNNPPVYELSKRFSAFVCMNKQDFKPVAENIQSILHTPQMIIMQADSNQLQNDLELLLLLKTNPLFKNAPVIMFTLDRTADDTSLYFNYGAVTCVVMPAPPHEWTNIIHYIPAYWLDAA